MKNLILGAAIVAASTSMANAQIQKGNWMVGGNVVTSGFNLDKGGNYNFSIQPKATYFVEDNTAIGGYVNLGVSGAKGAPTSFNYGVGAVGRYFLSPGEHGVDNLLNHGRFFLEGNAGVGGTSQSKGGSTANGLDFGFGPGYAYFLTPNIGLEGLVKYNGNAGFGNAGYTNHITFNVGLSIYLPTSKVKTIKNEIK